MKDKNPLRSGGVNRRQIMAYTAPMIGVVFLAGPMGVIQGVYAKYFGVPLTSIAAIYLLSRLFDVITDPLIGYLSDRYRVKKGTRKPFVLVGGVALIPCSYFLFVPPDNVSLTYFSFWLFSHVLAYTVYSLPNLAWANELTNEPDARVALFSVLAIVGQIGGLLFFMVPFLPFFETTSITPEVLKVSVIAGSCLVLPGLYYSVMYAPDGQWEEVEKVDSIGMIQSVSFFLKAIANNSPFHIFLAAHSLSGLAQGMFFGLFFIYVDVFLGMGKEFVKISIIGIFFSFLTIPVIYRLTTKFGKRNVWFFSMVAMLFGLFCAGLLTPETAGFFDVLALLLLLGLCGSCFVIVAPSILADIIDYGQVYDRAERRGSYLAFYTLLVKAQAAIGMALSMVIAESLGFDAAAATSTPAGYFAIKVAISWVPGTILLLSLPFIWRTPLNENRNAIVRRRLDINRRVHLTG